MSKKPKQDKPKSGKGNWSAINRLKQFFGKSFDESKHDPCTNCNFFGFIQIQPEGRIVECPSCRGKGFCDKVET